MTRRPKQLSISDRSLTAPARLVPLMLQHEDDNLEDYDDDDSISDRLSSQISDLYPPFGKAVAKATLPNFNEIDDGQVGRIQEQGIDSVSKPRSEVLSQNEMFTMWLRNDDESFNGTLSTESISSRSKDIPTVDKRSPTTLLGKSSVPSSENITGTPADSDEANIVATDENELASSGPVNPSRAEQELFSKFARGEQSTWTNSSDGNSMDSFTRHIKNRENDSVDLFKSGLNSTGSIKFMNTFHLRPTGNIDGDDDGSVIDDEQKKLVGVNDHLSKAIALLEDDGQQLSNDNTTLEQSQVLLAANDGNRKRPLTNYELTIGCIPLFGTDDAPLPQETDLGIHETKEEQQRAIEKKRSQEIIDKFVAPNIFGPIACPNPATGPDDFHSWMSRTVTSTSGARISVPSATVDVPTGGDTSHRRQFNSYGSSPSTFDPLHTPPMQRESTRSRSEGNSIDIPINLPLSQTRGQSQSQQQYVHRQYSRPPKHTSKRPGDIGLSPPSAGPRSGKRLQVQSRSRYGWWSPADESLADEEEGAVTDGDENVDENILQIPPIQHSSSGIQVLTLLDPSPEKLRTDNLPLSRMHAATSMEQCLPYLSDRPHSHRYLQIDTQAIAFPPLKGEIEPLFCSLAIYNVEAMLIIGNAQGSGERATGNTTSNKAKAAPLPNWQRCGRVTEALCFDFVSDTDVAQRCSGALYPNQKVTTVFETDFYSPGDAADQTIKEQLMDSLQTTRCGVFPIPSNLNVANLYAVLIVRKVISEESDLDPYVKTSPKTLDLEKLRSNATKNSDHHGCFLMPFAFGVAPLMQVFGADNPYVPSSRAVQIPLFRFIDKESQIIDHIMVMLFPK
jgi:hypothetical protein